MSDPRRILELAITHSGAGAVIRRFVPKRRVSILVYHDPAPEVLEVHLAYVTRRYHVVSLSSVVDAHRESRWDSVPNYPLVVTFDDGWRGNTDLVEICRRFRCPITIYVCSQVVGTSRHYWWTEANGDEQRLKTLKTLPAPQRLAALRATGFEQQRDYPDRQCFTWAETVAMADIAELGSHTRFHPILTTCSDSDAETEIILSKSEIEQATGRSCEHFAFPNGDYTDRERAIVAQAGYRSARTIDVGWNTATTDPLQLRTLGVVPDDASLRRLKADLAGAGFAWRWLETHKLDGRHPTVMPSDPVEVSPGEVPVVDVEHSTGRYP